jgi:hypothetical protein
MEGETVAWEIAVSDPAETSRRMRISQGDDSSERKDFVLSATNGVTIRDGYAYIPRGVTSFKLRVTAVVDGWGAPNGQKFRPGQGYAEGTEKLVLKLSAKAEEAKTLSVTIKESERRTVRALLKTVLPGLYGNTSVFGVLHHAQTEWWKSIKNINIFKHVSDSELTEFFGPKNLRSIDRKMKLYEYVHIVKDKAVAKQDDIRDLKDNLAIRIASLSGFFYSNQVHIVGAGSSAETYFESQQHFENLTDLLGKATKELVSTKDRKGIVHQLAVVVADIAKSGAPSNFGLERFIDLVDGSIDTIVYALKYIEADIERYKRNYDAARQKESKQASLTNVLNVVGAIALATQGGMALAGSALMLKAMQKNAPRPGDPPTTRLDELGDIASNMMNAITLSDVTLGAISYATLRDIRKGGTTFSPESLQAMVGGAQAWDTLLDATKDDAVSKMHELNDAFQAFTIAYHDYLDFLLMKGTKEGFTKWEMPSGTAAVWGQEYGVLYEVDEKRDGVEHAYAFWERKRWEDIRWLVPKSWFQLAPVVLDLDGDGFAFTPLAASAASYDANGDGERERIAWVGKRDGILSYDKNDDGLISATDEISFVGYREGAKTDLEGLVAFDTNANGKLDAGDAEWNRFQVWTDTNGDGISDHGELVSLDEAGIASISLVSDKIQYEENDVTVFGTAEVERVDGTKINAADAAFAYKPNALDARLLQLKAAIAGMAPAGQGPGSVTQEAYQRTLAGAIAAA